MKKYIITEEQLLEALLSNVRETRIESFEVYVNEMRNDFGSVVHTIKDTSLEEYKEDKQIKLEVRGDDLVGTLSKPQQSMSRAVKDRFSDHDNQLKVINNQIERLWNTIEEVYE